MLDDRMAADEVLIEDDAPVGKNSTPADDATGHDDNPPPVRLSLSMSILCDDV